MPKDDNTIFLIPRLSLYLLVTRVSQSYERKSECLIRRKLEVLRKEIPLLSKSIIDNFRVFQSEVVDVSDALPTFNHNPLHRQCYCNNRKANHVRGQTTNAILDGLSAVGAAIGDVCKAPNG